MRFNSEENKERLERHAVGFLAALTSFAILWPADVTSTRLRFYPYPIFEGGMKQSTVNYLNAISPNHSYQGIRPLCHSFINQGFYWGFLYSILAGSFTIPAQEEFSNQILNKTSANDYADKRTIQASAGWLAALIQLTILHPVDSMKVIAQRNPEKISNQVMQYFSMEQSQLRRGTGVVALGSISYFFAWYMKFIVRDYLNENNCNITSTKMISALAFSLTHMAIAFPFNTVKTWAQGDIDFVARNATFLNKTKRTVQITSDNIKKIGFSSLYRGFFSRGLMFTGSFAFNMYLNDTIQLTNKLSR